MIDFYTPADDRIILRMRGAGETFAAIGAALVPQRSADGVRSRLRNSIGKYGRRAAKKFKRNGWGYTAVRYPVAVDFGRGFWGDDVDIVGAGRG